MTTQDPLVQVLIDPTREPIAGTVTHGVGEPTEFVGYAHLVAEIERHRQLAAPGSVDKDAPVRAAGWPRP